MKNDAHVPRYNRVIRKMRARMPGGLRLGLPVSFRVSLLASLLLATVFLPTFLCASNAGDAARLLADRISAASGPGSVQLEVTNRSSLDDKLVREVRSALEAELRVRGVSTAAADRSVGKIEVILSESLREYVWIATITTGLDAPRVALISLPRAPSTTPPRSALPVTLKKTLLFAQERPILDAVLIDAAGGGTFGGSTSGSTMPTAPIPAGARLFILDPTRVATYRMQAGRWEIEASLPIQRGRGLPRDVRGRLLLRRDHLFDVYLPGTFCRSSAAAPLTLSCSANDDPWPLASDENAANGGAQVRAFYAPARNFFTGIISPSIGKIPNVPSFYSAAPLPRSNYTLWVLAGIDGTIHLVDGITDQTVHAGRAGTDLAAIHSSCGIGTQLLASDAGDTDRDTLRAFEIPDREPVAVSSPLEFDGAITALWTEPVGSGGDASTSAVAIVKREDSDWYEANRITVTCAN